MTAKPVLMLLAFFLALAVAPHVVAQEKPIADKKQASDADINKLIAGLGNSSFKVREDALQRLTGIGLPALQALQDAAAKGDLETKLRAQLIIKKLNAVQANGLIFKLVVDPVCKVPAPKAKEVGSAAIDIRLEVTNMTDKAFRLSAGSFYIYLIDPDGKEVQNKVTSKSRTLLNAPMPMPSVPLAKKGRATILRKMMVAGDGLFGFAMSQNFFQPPAQGLRKYPAGTYFVSVAYSNYFHAEDPGDPYWTGEVKLDPQPIWISL
ncbi:MAG TPA: hypothetical protein VE988_07105 [Gemmataceae bacterium]|nr:hypothetical protein [Gemmataceae bacterium]